MTRLRAAGAVLAAQTTASEFGGVNCTSTRLHGVTRNPWDTDRTPGGSSGGSAAAVAGGLVPIASGGDGGRVDPHPRRLLRTVRPEGHLRPHPPGPGHPAAAADRHVGCLSRSVRDTARWFDVCNGFDPRDNLSLPRVSRDGRPASARIDLAGKRAVVSVDLGAAVVEPRVAAW